LSGRGLLFQRFVDGFEYEQPSFAARQRLVGIPRVRSDFALESAYLIAATQAKERGAR
jgi:hypothetical protein